MCGRVNAWVVGKMEYTMQIENLSMYECGRQAITRQILILWLQDVGRNGRAGRESSTHPWMNDYCVNVVTGRGHGEEVVRGKGGQSLRSPKRLAQNVALHVVVSFIRRMKERKAGDGSVFLYFHNLSISDWTEMKHNVSIIVWFTCTTDCHPNDLKSSRHFCSWPFS